MNFRLRSVFCLLVAPGLAAFAAALPSADPQIVTIAGNGTIGLSADGGIATAMAFANPTSTAIDSAGNIYLADPNNYRVRKISASTHKVTTVVGSGAYGFSGDGGPATKAALRYPIAIALDTAGNLYIADAYNNRVREVSASTGIITTVAGTSNPGNGTGDGGLATDAYLGAVYGVAVDGGGNIYLSDCYNGRVRKVAAATGIITTAAGNGGGNYAGDGNPAQYASLSFPSGITLDSAGNLYIADTGHNLIRKVTATTGIISTVAGYFTSSGGTYGRPLTAQLLSPMGVAADNVGNIYIADTGNNRVLKASVSSGVVTPLAGTFAAGYSGDGHPAALAMLDTPWGVTVDNNGNVYVADSGNAAVREISFTPPQLPRYVAMPVFSVSAGTYFVAQTLAITDKIAGATIYYTTDGTTPTTASTKYAGAIAVSASQTVKAIATLQGSSQSGVRSDVYVITGVTSPEIVTIAGNGTYGFSGEAGVATGAQLGFPNGLALDTGGNIYVADPSNARIRKISAMTHTITTVAGNGSYGFSGDGGAATSAQLEGPVAVAVDAAGNIYIADVSNERIRKVSATTGIISTVAGNGGYGFSGDGGPATGAELWSPTGVSVDSTGNIYIADTKNSRIRKVSASTGIITTVVGSGALNGGGDGGQATNASLIYPEGVATDSANNIYIADTGDARIRKVTSSSGIITTVAGNGYHGFTGDGVKATSTALNSPHSLATDSAGNLYIADSNNLRLRKVSAMTGIITTIAGNGIFNYTGDQGPATAATLSNLSASVIDSAGNIYLADSSYYVIREVSLTPLHMPRYAATPVFNVVSFNPNSVSYSGGRTVTVSDATPGAVTYYTTDGSVPTVASTVYAAPLNIAATQTLRAIAVQSGYLNSRIATVTPTINGPGIASMTSVALARGATVSIAGAGFGATQGSSIFMFNGVAATTSSWSDTAIKVRVPEGASSGYAVAVVGGKMSNGVYFMVQPSPTVTGITPAAAPIGMNISIAGTGFGSLRANEGVNFTGAAGRIINWSDTSILVQVPGGAKTGSLNVFARGVFSNSIPFTVLPSTRAAIQPPGR